MVNINESSLNDKSNLTNPYKLFEIKVKNSIKKNFLERNISSPKSIKRHFKCISPYIIKRLKNITLSNFKYKKYISLYDKITKENCFKVPNNSCYPKRKNFQYMHISYVNINNKNNNYNIHNNKTPTPGANRNIFNMTNDMNINNNNFNDKFLYKNFSDDNLNQDETVKETPYGFKYKNTKVILDLKKYKKDKNINNFLYKNIKFNPVQNKEGELKVRNNKFFLDFSDGIFFENSDIKNSMLKKYLNKKNEDETSPIREEFYSYDEKYIESENREYFLKKEKNILFLFEEMKKIENKSYNFNYDNNEIFQKKFEYDILSQLKKSFHFIIEIKSIYLEFIEIDPRDNFKNGQKQKVYFPFYYIPLFYLLDFVSFKCFLSELIIYDNTNNKFEIDLNNEINILNKYIKNAEIYYNNYPKMKDKINSKMFNDITYNSNESKYNVNYDWCIYNKYNKNNDNKIYKMKICLPVIKFNFKEKKIKIYKYINKNLMIELMKKNFENWNKYIIFNLFIIKRFRIIINNILSHKFSAYSNKKIFLDENYKIANYIKKNYEFFITSSYSKINKYFYFVPITAILANFINLKKVKTNFIQLSIKDTNNINKLSQYLGINNILLKCLYCKKEVQEPKLNMSLIDNISDDFIKIVEKENIIKNIKIKNNYDESEIFKYKINNNEINIILRKPKIINISYNTHNIILKYFDMPKILLDDILHNVNGEHYEHIYKSINNIILNDEIFEESRLINYNKEIINLIKGESLIKKDIEKMLVDIKNNAGNSLFYGKFNKKMKIVKNFTRLFRNTNLLKNNTNLFNYNNKTNYAKISLKKKNSNFSDYKK